MQLREMAAKDLCTCVLGRTRKSLLEPGLLLLASPQIIADTLDNPDDQARAAKYIDERASRGLRSIAVAQAPGGGGGASGGWRLVGLISLLDPPRPDSAATILRAQELGVEVRPPLALCWTPPDTPPQLLLQERTYCRRGAAASGRWGGACRPQLCEMQSSGWRPGVSLPVAAG